MTVEEPFPIDYSDLELKYAMPPMDTSMSNVLIVKNLPQVDQSKEEKLLAVLQKNVFGKDAKVAPGGFFMPRDETTNLTKGYLFVEFGTAEEAEHVLRNAQGFKLDKSHVLTFLRFSDLEEALNLDENFQELPMEVFEEKEYLKSWLADPQARDQFLVHQLGQSTITIAWNNKHGNPQNIVQRTGWADAGCAWSSRGSFLATLHHQGVALWGGEALKKMARLPHPEVQKVIFSASEKYMISLGPKSSAEDNVLLWDLATSKLVRGFHMTWEDAEKTKFSAKDQYFARVSADELFIHELPSGHLLDKKAIKLDLLQNFEWSPADAHLIIYWTKGNENTPGRFSLMNAQTREVIRSKNIFLVDSCDIAWHNEGNYAAILINRTSKTKKNLFTSLELFRIREKGVPVDVVEFDTVVKGLYWQPAGSKFLTVVNQGFVSHISLYSANEEENGMTAIKLLKTLERKQISYAAFGPKGDFFALAGTESSSMQVEFWQLTNSSEHMAMLASREHFLATELVWEPAGRFLASWVNVRKHTQDNSVCIWDLKGDLVAKLPFPKLLSFAWRPRPPSLLSKDDFKEIRKQLKQLSVQFEEEDVRAMAQETLTAGDLRRRFMEEWQAFRQSAREAYANRRALRESIVGKSASQEEDYRTVEEWIEEVVEETEEMIDS